MAIVYLATNTLNGKRYVGATIHTLTKRTKEHKCSAFRKYKREKNMVFYKAVRKHGFAAFSFSILIECEQEKVFFEEIRMIALLKPEYNMTTGGEGCLGRKMSEYCRHRLAEGRAKNMKKTIKVARALSKTKESRERFNKYRALGPAALARKVLCVDDQKVFESAGTAARHYGAAKSAVVELCLGKNGRKTVNGRVFVYFIGDEKQVA